MAVSVAGPWGKFFAWFRNRSERGNSANRSHVMEHNQLERTAAVPEDLTGRPRRVATGGVSWRKTFSAFQHRNYRLYFWGQLVSLIGTWMTSTAQGWLVYQLTGSKALLGIVAAAGTAPMLVFSTLGGWAADRFPK